MTNPRGSSNLKAPARFVSIADLVKRLGVTSRALRHYQDQGLIRSHRIAHNARAYDLDMVAVVEAVVALRDVDMPIVTIRKILSLSAEPPKQVEALREALAELMADKQQQIARILTLLEAAPELLPTPVPPRAPLALFGSSIPASAAAKADFDTTLSSLKGDVG